MPAPLSQSLAAAGAALAAVLLHADSAPFLAWSFVGVLTGLLALLAQSDA